MATVVFLKVEGWGLCVCGDESCQGGQSQYDFIFIPKSLNCESFIHNYFLLMLLAMARMWRLLKHFIFVVRQQWQECFAHVIYSNLLSPSLLLYILYIYRYIYMRAHTHTCGPLFSYSTVHNRLTKEDPKPVRRRFQKDFRHACQWLCGVCRVWTIFFLFLKKKKKR